MVGVVSDGNIFAEERIVHAFEKAGTLVGQSGSGEIVKKKTDQIEDSGWPEDYRVFSGCQFLRVPGHLRLFAGAGGKLLRIEIANIARVGFGPTGGGFIL